MRLLVIGLNINKPTITLIISCNGKFKFKCMFGYRVWVCVCALYAFCMGPVRCSRDPQVLFSAKTTLKLGLTTLFTHLKIILLQCFQFSAISGIQTDPM